MKDNGVTFFYKKFSLSVFFYLSIDLLRLLFSPVLKTNFLFLEC